MKKARRLALILLGIPTLAVAVLWIDATFRAVAAIRAEDERLVRDIAAARSRRTSDHPAFPFEDGHHISGPVQARFQALIRTLQRTTAEQILVDLATLRDRLSEGGYLIEYHRFQEEMQCLIQLQKILKTESDVGRFAEPLDRLEKTRPTLSDIVTGEHLLDRAEVLRVLHRKDDPTGMIRRPPGWKEFFSWRILIAKTLRELDDHHREIQDRVARGSVGGTDANRKVSEEPGVLSRTRLRIRIDSVADREETLTLEWKQLREALERPR